MKIKTKSGDIVEVVVSFPLPNQLAIKATQDNDLLGYEQVSDIEASYRFTNNLEPFK